MLTNYETIADHTTIFKGTEKKFQLTENFHLKELIDTAQEISLQYQFEQVSEDVFYNLQRLTRTILQPLRNHYGVPVYVNSGFRSKKLNPLVGGVEASYHLSGRAADIEVTGQTPEDVQKYINENFNVIENIVYSHHLHIAIR